MVLRGGGRGFVPCGGGKGGFFSLSTVPRVCGGGGEGDISVIFHARRLNR